MISSYLLVILFSISALTVFSQNSNSTKKCLALALEGGGDAAAYEIGVLKGLVENLDPEDVQYQVISGVSAGAINGFIISQYPIGEEQAMVDEILNLYQTNLSQNSVYKSWGWGDIGVVEGMFDKPGVYNNAPLAEFLQNYAQEHDVYRKFTIGVTDATYVQKLTFYGDQLSKENLAKAVLASTSMPFIFPYFNNNNQEILMDGGCLLNIDIESAIARCKEIVDDEKDIIVDALMQTEASIDVLNASQTYTSLDMLDRYMHIRTYKNSLDSLLEAVYNHPDVNFRYVVFPTKKLPRFIIPIYYTQKDLEEMIAQGEQDAISAINNASSSPLNNLNFNLMNLKRTQVMGNDYFDGSSAQSDQSNFIQEQLKQQ